ncbi:3-dehydroquinate synthase [Bergeyella porcorum]|uniref:3-dehydroquinate synthase n=1 Tax=Bergeyella porcorum TaxID=1735111 RepID=A0AAU0F0I3_9FLAO
MITTLDDNFSQLNQYIQQCSPSKILILVDENTHQYCLPTLLGNLETDIPFEVIEIEAGEELKNINTAVQLWEILSEFEADRSSLLINLGGGVITDMGGFIASTYKRGFPFVHIPTTLLAMCDASIGGKTGIDHLFLKNIIGTFALPDHLFVYPPFLKTLPYEELISGFAEMLKHGLIADATHWEQLTAIDTLSAEAIAPMIERSMQIKQKVVEQDFKEMNIRKTLNFGHTIGHAIESLFLKQGNLIPHGVCVAIGMIAETWLAVLENLIDEPTATSIVQNISKYYPYVDISGFTNEDILAMMRNDKKNADGKINFSLLKNIGNGLFDCKCSEANILKSLNFYRTLNH